MGPGIWLEGSFGGLPISLVILSARGMRWYPAFAPSSLEGSVGFLISLCLVHSLLHLHM